MEHVTTKAQVATTRFQGIKQMQHLPIAWMDTIFIAPVNNNNTQTVNLYTNSIYKYNDSTSDTVIVKGDSAASSNY